MKMIESAARTDHENCNQLLPWYANETLGPDERQAVEAHLANCSECQEDLALLAKMRTAVLDEESLPISVPLESANVIERGPSRRTVRQMPVAWRLAAALLLALPVAWLLLTSVPNQQFETVTSESQTATVQYVLELQFDAGLSPEEVDALMQELGTPVANASGDLTSRVLVELMPKSLAELEAHAQDIARRPGIESAEFVALQVPVR